MTDQSYIEFHMGEVGPLVEERLLEWEKNGFLRRLWNKDPTLWASAPDKEILNGLGWLSLPESMILEKDRLAGFVRQVQADQIQQVVLLGMGGSSLAPEVFSSVFGSQPGYPSFVVLDSTHPDAILSLRDGLNISQTLFVVSSKSGTTLETLSLFRYFWKEVSQVVSEPGSRFIAITDPGSFLEKLARERQFRLVFSSPQDVGGRYSALSFFGLVPAAMIGMDIPRFLNPSLQVAQEGRQAKEQGKSCGLTLGIFLGDMASVRDKWTFLASPSLENFPDWLEQLIAESLGKEGKGIVPIVHEPVLAAEKYKKDRVFVFLFLQEEENTALVSLRAALKDLGHPVVSICLEDRYALSREIFLWEIAVSAAASIMKVHPFNQPHVQLTKDLTQKIMASGRESARDRSNECLAKDSSGLQRALGDWMKSARNGSYVALQAFLPFTPEMFSALQEVRLGVLKRLGLATTLGFGPRFLHSTGQMHKGGSDKGLFIQLVDDPEAKLPVPETHYSFKDFLHAQAMGDFQALSKTGRNILRINLQNDKMSGIENLKKSIEAL